MSTYAGSKALAERAVWEFVVEHPDINITVRKYPVFELDSENLWINPQSQ